MFYKLEILFSICLQNFCIPITLGTHVIFHEKGKLGHMTCPNGPNSDGLKIKPLDQNGNFYIQTVVNLMMRILLQRKYIVGCKLNSVRFNNLFPKLNMSLSASFSLLTVNTDADYIQSVLSFDIPCSLCRFRAHHKCVYNGTYLLFLVLQRSQWISRRTFMILIIPRLLC